MAAGIKSDFHIGVTGRKRDSPLHAILLYIQRKYHCHYPSSLNTDTR